MANLHLHRGAYELNDTKKISCVSWKSLGSKSPVKNIPSKVTVSEKDRKTPKRADFLGFCLAEEHVVCQCFMCASEIISIQMATSLLPFTDWKTMEGWWTMKTNGVPSCRTSLSRNGFQGRSSSSQWAFPSLCFRINHVNLLIFKFIHF